jgi:hypothetical protein
MIKQLIMIAALVPTTAAAHDFDQYFWLQRWLDNRMDIGACLKLSTADISKFHRDCGLDSMVRIENATNLTYKSQKLSHPGISDMEFIEDHFPNESEKYIIGIYLNVEATPQFAAGFLHMYVVKGLTQNSYAVYAPEGSNSTVDERPGNNAIHDK